MTLGGWIFVVISWGIILVVVSYCMIKVIKGDR